ncbi:MAG: peptidylprolyl isomerase [Spirochaetales bacterium]|nr:peptidylprolyl isomerase [Spirochaetales bacterium]
MKKTILFWMILLMCNSVGLFAQTLHTTLEDLSDDAVVVEVGEYGVTALELKMYMAGYQSIKEWNGENILSVLNSMVLDLLFTNACLEEKITVKQSEVLYYTEYYFDKIGIDLNDENKVQAYFDTTDPYANMEDFLNKSTFFLLKMKYFAKKGLLPTTKVSHVFFSTKKKTASEKKMIQNRVSQTFYDIEMGDVTFTDMFKLYSEDENTKNSLGDIGSCSLKTKNEYIPKKKVKDVLEAGLFVPVIVENSKGYSIVLNTTSQFPSGNELDSLIQDLFKKFPPKYYISF